MREMRTGCTVQQSPRLTYPYVSILNKLLVSSLYLTLTTVLFSCGVGNPNPAGQLTPPSASVPEDLMAVHENDAALFSEIYPVSAENPFIIASFDEVVRQFEFGTGILVFAFPSCPRCKNAFPVLEKAFKEMDMERYAGFRGKILYYDIYDDREANNERYQTLVDFTKEFLPADDSGNPRIYSPHVFFLVSGEIVGHHLDTVPSLTNPQDLLNSEQQAELLAIYKDLIQRVEDCGC